MLNTHTHYTHTNTHIHTWHDICVCTHNNTSKCSNVWWYLDEWHYMSNLNISIDGSKVWCSLHLWIKEIHTYMHSYICLPCLCISMCEFLKRNKHPFRKRSCSVCSLRLPKPALYYTVVQIHLVVSTYQITLFLFMYFICIYLCLLCVFTTTFQLEILQILSIYQSTSFTNKSSWIDKISLDCDMWW